jgi:hypothetical protein
MHTRIILLAIAGGLVAFAHPADACSIRGNYCGYPSWAANAFEGRFGFKGNPRILTEYYPDFGSKKPLVLEPKSRKRHR